MNDLPSYQTSDLLETAYLLVSDARLLSAKRDGARVIFTFSDRPTCEGLTMNLTLGRAMVDASEFFDAIRKAKRIVHTI